MESAQQSKELSAPDMKALTQLAEQMPALQTLLQLAQMLNAKQAVTVPAVKAPTKKVDWTEEHHKCPQCGHEGPVKPDFGVRTVRGVELKQAWCRSCRASTNYHNKPRQNRSR